MSTVRLLSTAVLAASLSTATFAQTASGSAGPGTASGQAGALNPADPSAPPPVNGPTNAPSSGGGATQDSASPGSMGSGSMSPGGAPAPGANPPVGMTAPYTPITPAPGANIVAVLQASGQFSTLVKALAATNLTGVLQSKGPLTVFAPTDAAFAALPPGTLDTLMQPANLLRLQRILTYHVVAAKVSSSQFVGHTAGKVTTAAQVPVTLDGETPPLKVNGVAVIQPDVRASNGTIFVIDKVLMPAG